MASGSTIFTTSNEYIDAKVEWSSVADTAKNQSTVTAALYYKRNNTGFTTTGTGTFSLSINVDKTTETKSITITESGWVKAIEHTVKVDHNSDGTKITTITGSGKIPGTTLSNGHSFSMPITLDNIPREATFDSLSCATKYFTGNMTYKYTVKNASNYHRVNIALNINGSLTAVKTINLGKTSAAQQTASVTLSSSELSTIYNALPSASKSVLRFTLRTYSDSGYSKEIGSGKAREITLSIPQDDTTKPTATLTIAPVSDLASPFNTMYIQGKTKIQATLSNLKGKYGASIVSSYIEVDDREYSSPCTTEFLTQAYARSVDGYIKDSRGFTNRVSVSVKVEPYASPRILPTSGESRIVCDRCDADGNLADNGSYLKIKAVRQYSKLNWASNTQKNFCEIQYRYKPNGGSYSSWTTILATGASSDEVVTGALLGGALDTTMTYVVQVRAIDSLGEKETTTINVYGEGVYMHRAGSINSLGIGKMVDEENTVDIAEDLTTKFRGPVRFAGESWQNLGLSSEVSASQTAVGRWGGTGCYYRVCAGDKHIYVAFNCLFSFENSMVRVNADLIPSAYRPDRDVYSVCSCKFSAGERAIASCVITPSGKVLVEWVHIVGSSTKHTGAVTWIDGYIDYWT
jgi:hypothetical protein